MLGKAKLGRSMLLAAGLSGFALLGGGAPAQARDRDDSCAQCIRNAVANLDREVRRHGEHSRQAAKRRHQLEEARERCRVDRDRDRHRDRDLR